MAHINDSPEVLGHLIGSALVGTFLGILLSYCVCSPLVSQIKVVRSKQHRLYVVVKQTLLAYMRKIIIVMLIATAIVAIADVFWTRYHWFTELKMTKHEVKEENKQSQGDPFVKSRQRSVMRDRARRRMIASVQRATLVIANPTHYAVALRYVREENDAPVVLAKGQDLIALKIREIAEENSIPVFEDPPLARSMLI